MTYDPASIHPLRDPGVELFPEAMALVVMVRNQRG